MENAFEKILCFTDIHFGHKQNSREHNQLCLDFIEWALGIATEKSCDAVAFLGDWHDHRTSIGVDTLNYSERGLRLLSESGFKVYFVIGNHDLFYRENRSVNSLPFAENHDITLISDPLTVGDTVFVPWIVPGEDYSKIVSGGTKYVFGHLELPGFLMNGGYAAPAREGRATAEDFAGPEYVFTGHFHARQVKRVRDTEIHYIGNCFPHDFSDAGDTSRGVMVLERGGKPEYLDWPDAPSYHYVKVSQMDDIPVEKMNSRSVVKITPDAEMSEDEKKTIELFFSEELGVSKVVTEPYRKSDTEVKKFEGDDVDSTEVLAVNWMKHSEDIPSDIDREFLVHLFLDSKERV